MQKHRTIWLHVYEPMFVNILVFIFFFNDIFVYQLLINVHGTGNILEPTATVMWLEITGIRETHFLGE